MILKELLEKYHGEKVVIKNLKQEEIYCGRTDYIANELYEKLINKFSYKRYEMNGVTDIFLYISIV